MIAGKDGHHTCQYVTHSIFIDIIAVDSEDFLDDANRHM